MSNVLVDKNPGYYLDPLTVNVSFGPEVKEVSLNLNGTPPSISKYISYDTLNPPNPFIAITQDGNGNVIYDGGFPKFYNGSAENPNTVRFRHAVKIKSTRTVAGGNIRIGLSDALTIVEPGDKLIYDMLVIGNDAFFAIKGYAGTMANIQDGEDAVTDVLVDQNGVPLHYGAGANLHPHVNNKWYTRTFDLTPIVGKEINRWTIIGGNGPVGTSSVYFKNARIVNSGGLVKTPLIKEGAYEPMTEPFVTGNFGLVEHREASSFDLLSSVAKYALNCIDFIVDQDEVRQGNRKILLIGDQVTAGNYSVKGTGGDQFSTTFGRIAHHGYWDLTIKDRSDYGGYIDARLPELKQYAAVLFMSSIHGVEAFITQASIDAFVTYRYEGGGLFFITDHGVPLGTIAQAQGYHSGFFRTANAVITRFGAWFSGDYNRIPVNVGFLRTNYGDHPLYKNLDDSENIPAGGSESRVFVTSDPLTPPANVNKSFPITSGNNSINLLVVLNDGTIETHNFNYNIVDFKVTYNAHGQVVDSGGTIRMGTKDKLTLSLDYTGTASRVMTGNIFVNGVSIGSVHKPANQQFVINFTNPFVSNGIPINNDDFIYLKFSNPAGLEYGVRISRDKIHHIDTANANTWPELSSKINNIYPEKSNLYKLRNIVEDSLNSGGVDKYPLSEMLKLIKQHLRGPFYSMEPTVRLTVASFNAPQHWYGFFLFGGGPTVASGIVNPPSHYGIPFRDINSPVDNQMQLQLGTLNNVFTRISVIYLDDVGPLYIVRDTGVDAGGVHRVWFGNGVVNIYKYLESKLGEVVEVRILG